jgi:hypothetical protein
MCIGLYIFVYIYTYAFVVSSGSPYPLFSYGAIATSFSKFSILTYYPNLNFNCPNISVLYTRNTIEPFHAFVVLNNIFIVVSLNNPPGIHRYVLNRR